MDYSTTGKKRKCILWREYQLHEYAFNPLDLVVEGVFCTQHKIRKFGVVGISTGKLVLSPPVLSNSRLRICLRIFVLRNEKFAQGNDCNHILKKKTFASNYVGYFTCQRNISTFFLSVLGLLRHVKYIFLVFDKFCTIISW